MARTPEPTRLSTISSYARSEFARQRLLIRIPLLTATAGSLLGVGLVLLINRLTGIPLVWLTRDTASVIEQPGVIGILSNLGIMAWAAATALWLFSWALLRRTNPRHYLAGFTLASGLLTLLLLLDDAFMLHEDALPILLGIPELLVLIAYLCIILAYAFLNWHPALRTFYLPGLLAGGLLAASFAMDLLLPTGPRQTVVEDSFKFAGILFWLAYAVTVAGQVIDELHTDP